MDRMPAAGAVRASIRGSGSPLSIAALMVLTAFTTVRRTGEGRGVGGGGGGWGGEGGKGQEEEGKEHNCSYLVPRLRLAYGTLTICSEHLASH